MLDEGVVHKDREAHLIDNTQKNTSKKSSSCRMALSNVGAVSPTTNCRTPVEMLLIMYPMAESKDSQQRNPKYDTVRVLLLRSDVPIQ